jgi:lactoylglutathione lyase
MAKAIHSMIRVLDLARSIDFYDRALGLKVYEQFEFDDFTLAYLRNEENEFELELTLNKGRAEPYRLRPSGRMRKQLPCRARAACVRWVATR